MADRSENETTGWMSTEFLLVGVAGAIGGFFNWMLVADKDASSSFLATSVLFGFGAALLFVFVIANTDRQDRARLLVIALLSGFAWQTVWDTAKTMIGEQPKKPSVFDIAEQKKPLALDAERPPAEASEPKSTEPPSESNMLTEASPDFSPETLLEAIQQYSRDRFFGREGQEVGQREFEQFGVLKVGGEPIESRKKEFRLEVPTPHSGRLSIEVEAEERQRDLVATLYEYNGKKLSFRTIDDDSGDGLNPFINEYVSPGEYVLSLNTYDGPVGSVRISAKLVWEEDL